METQTKSVVHTFTRYFAAILLIAMAAMPAGAADIELNNPYTIYGLQVRTHLWTEEANGRMKDLGPMVFQEIVPCRLVSTLDADNYPHPWGGDAFAPNEVRTYMPAGILVSGDFTNPCSDIVPVGSFAVALRLTSHEAQGDGTIYLAPASEMLYEQAALRFAAGESSLKEANVVLNLNMFRVMAADHATDLTIDVIGYFLHDFDGGGGEKGDRGEKGEKGDRGEAGAQGEQGEKGDRGEAGAQGEKGEKGDRGEAGAQGEKGDRGEQGLQGQRGERGENGAKGDRGEAGAQGAQGAKGDKGDRGLQGPAGPPSNSNYSVGGTYTFPPGGSLRINDSSVGPNSFIVPVYVEVSNGNAIAIESVGRGSFVASGSPNKDFRYIVFN